MKLDQLQCLEEVNESLSQMSVNGKNVLVSFMSRYLFFYSIFNNLMYAFSLPPMVSLGSVPQDSFKDVKEPVDFLSKLADSRIQELDSIEALGVGGDLGGPQDLSSWLNFDEIQWALKYLWMTSQI